LAGVGVGTGFGGGGGVGLLVGLQPVKIRMANTLTIPKAIFKFFILKNLRVMWRYCQKTISTYFRTFN
jgi:hypothetical protein